MAAKDDKKQTLYVQIETLQQLIAEKRVGIWDQNGPLSLSFHKYDPHFPGMLVDICEDVPPHTVCTRRFKARRKRVTVLEPFHDVAGHV